MLLLSWCPLTFGSDVLSAARIWHYSVWLCCDGCALGSGVWSAAAAAVVAVARTGAERSAAGRRAQANSVKFASEHCAHTRATHSRPDWLARTTMANAADGAGKTCIADATRRTFVDHSVGVLGSANERDPFVPRGLLRQGAGRRCAEAGGAPKPVGQTLCRRPVSLRPRTTQRREDVDARALEKRTSTWNRQRHRALVNASSPATSSTFGPQTKQSNTTTPRSVLYPKPALHDQQLTKMLLLVTMKRLPLMSSRIVTRLAAPSCRPLRHMSSDMDFKPSEDLAKERYDLRSGEDIARKRARLLYQSRKRGMLENGVILASFADKFLHEFDADHLDQYDRLINLPTNDWDIYYWATQTKPTPAEFETPVMALLRQHLNSKVSNGKILSDTVLGKSGLDEIVIPAAKKAYDIEIDIHKVDLTNYKENLFDYRQKEFTSGQSIFLMTPWRRRQLERRIRRAVSQPTSLAHLSHDDKRKGEQVYTQEAPQKNIACNKAVPKDLIQSDHEKYMRHHELLQHLLSGNLTDNPLEYDDEAEAWADMMWHRSYGSDDHLLSPVRDLKCSSCRTTLHCCDSGLKGYVPREIFVSIGVNNKLRPDNVTCQRCKFSSVYDAKLTYEMTPEDYESFLRHIAQDGLAIVVILIDLTDFPGSIWKNMINLIDGRFKRVIIVGNKVDLLPYDGNKILNRIQYSLRKNLAKLRRGKNLFINDLTVISARTGFGIAQLVTRILSFSDDQPRNVYILGSDNSGKSTLFSSLLQSDLCATRKGDIISRVSSYQLPYLNIKMLKFPVDLAEGWEVEMKKRKLEIVERNTEQRERSLQILTGRRRDSMPHMSSLINRLDYLPSRTENALMSSEQPCNHEKPQFSDDHPLANLEDGDPMSATQERFINNSFCFHTPSAPNPDQLHDLLTNDERLEVFPNETILPRKYSLRPLQTIFIAGLARLDLLTSQSSVIITIFASKYLPVHIIQTRKADKFYHQFLGSPYLGVPFGDSARLAVWPELVNSQPDFHITSQSSHMGVADIVFSSAGWAMISMTQDQECIVRAHTPEGRGISLRDPPLLSKACAKSTGKKIRDTPVFENPNYKIKTHRIDSMEQ